MLNKFSSIGLATFFWMFLALTPNARAQQTLGGITGTVTDDSGAVIPTATVTIVGDQTKLYLGDAQISKVVDQIAPGVVQPADRGDERNDATHLKLIGMYHPPADQGDPPGRPRRHFVWADCDDPRRADRDPDGLMVGQQVQHRNMLWNCEAGYTRRVPTGLY